MDNSVKKFLEDGGKIVVLPPRDKKQARVRQRSPYRLPKYKLIVIRRRNTDFLKGNRKFIPINQSEN